MSKPTKNSTDGELSIERVPIVAGRASFQKLRPSLRPGMAMMDACLVRQSPGSGDPRCLEVQLPGQRRKS